MCIWLNIGLLNLQMGLPNTHATWIINLWADGSSYYENIENVMQKSTVFCTPGNVKFYMANTNLFLFLFSLRVRMNFSQRRIHFPSINLRGLHVMFVHCLCLCVCEYWRVTVRMVLMNSNYSRLIIWKFRFLFEHNSSR